VGLKEEFMQKLYFLDTAPLIYFIEGNSQYQETLNAFFKANEDGRILMASSVLTITEILIHPLKLGKYELALKYRQILSGSDNFNIFDINQETAFQAAEMRAKYGIKTPDAFQIASGIQSKSDYFLTNDFQLKKVKEIEVILINELSEIILK
jgi:predicted nucleic acid-binding protein